MELSVSSETGRLKGVIVHTPGNEVSLVNPNLKEQLLFDDIIFEEDARQEHIDMLQIFKAAMPADGRIFQITDLIQECLQNADARNALIEALIRELPEDNLHTIEGQLRELQAKELLQFTVEGITPAIRHFSLPPSPNLLFTRDLAAVIGNHILLAKPAKKARLRESLLMKALIKYHPLFSDLNKRLITPLNHESIEGGDVLVASDKVVLIGMSKRTSFSALMSASEQLLDDGFEHVVAVDIPKKRSSMHLDTIFTFASENECIVFPPAIMQRNHNISVLSKNDDCIQSTTMPSLKEALEELLDRDITFIKCGGEHQTNQYREQWTDGANVFALAPGVIVGYERNTNTFQALKEQGYQIINQYEFIEKYKNTDFHPSGQKMAISFMGHELCRGRGGARCMTMPIFRIN